MKSTTISIVIALFGIIGLVFQSGCKEGEARAEATRRKGVEEATRANKLTVENSQNTQAGDVRAVNVKVAKLGTSSLTEHVLAYGVTKAQKVITYSAEIAGKLEYLSVDLGDRVKSGQTLARIDFKTLQAQAEQAQIGYELASNTYERLGALKDEDLISQQRLDETRSNMLSAKAGLAIAEANAKKARVVSSHSGIVARKFVERSEFVAPGTPLLMVVDYSTIIVEASLAETQVASVRRGAQVEVEIDALNERFKGTVETIIPTADSASKTFTLRVNIKNKDLRILIGMSATVRISAQTLDGIIVVPQSAVVEEQGERSVFIAKNGKAEKRSVQLGATDGENVAILTGVSQGESLIVMGQRDLVNGQPIHVVQ